MKYNKWTVALAALGVVSLASAARAEEKASPVMTALATTTISGYVDTSAQWNPNYGNENLPPYKFGGTDKADGFNLNVMQLRIDKPLDETDWAAGYRATCGSGRMPTRSEPPRPDKMTATSASGRAMSRCAPRWARVSTSRWASLTASSGTNPSSPAIIPTSPGRTAIRLSRKR